MGETDNEGKLFLSIFLLKKSCSPSVNTLAGTEGKLAAALELQHHFLISLSKGQITSEATLM